MSFAPHCGHFLLCKKIFLGTLERNKKKSEKAVYREKTVDRKEKISRKITTAFHSKEINMKNIIYYSVNNKRIFMK